MSLPPHLLRVGGVTRPLTETELEPKVLSREIEPWLAAILQSEHVSLLLGNGFGTAIAAAAGAPPAGMALVDFGLPETTAVTRRATELAALSGRGAPNIEDQIRSALQLVAGLEVLADPRAVQWRSAIGGVLGRFLQGVIDMERGIRDAIESGSPDGTKARSLLTSFLLTFASRPASRERLNLFTTNYDRVIEYGCDLVGLRPIDRFVGTLAPVFRASRLEVDMHYNPPGIRGEPRYLEGVIRLAKLHGSIDWRYADRVIRRTVLPFGEAATTLPADPYRTLIIYPNPAKDVETLEYPYAELFRDFSAALCRPNSAVITYGYGFGDDHINRVLADMLSIPSTHLVAISYADTSDRLEAFLGRVSRDQQVSLLIGSHLGDLSSLVQHYLPRPASDALVVRKAEISRKRDSGAESKPE
jgi:hypothetical protein